MRCTVEALPLHAATMSGVRPVRSPTFGSAPCLSRNVIIFGRPAKLAAVSAVPPRCFSRISRSQLLWMSSPAVMTDLSGQSQSSSE